MKRLPSVDRFRIFKQLLAGSLSGIILAVFVVFAVNMRGGFVRESENVLANVLTAETTQVLNITREKLGRYSDLLWAARAFIYSSQSVTRAEWAEYTASLKVAENYPSLTALEYVRKVPAEQLEIFMNQVRQDTSLVPEGYPDFLVTPAGTSGDAYVVDLLEPMAGNEAVFGFNLFSEPTRKKAIEWARDKNEFVMTEPVVLIQDVSGERGVLVMLPVYSANASLETIEQRRAQVQGLVMAVVKASDLFEKVLAVAVPTHLDGLSVSDVTENPANLISFIGRDGSLRASDLENSNPVQRARVERGNRTWEIEFWSSSRPQESAVAWAAPWMIGVLGLVVAVLVFNITTGAWRLQERAENLARELTKDLAKFRQAVEATADQVVITDPEGLVLYANPAMEQLTGYMREEAMGVKAGTLWGKQMEKEFYREMWETIKVKKQPWKGEVVNKHKSGRLYTVSIWIAPVIDDLGELQFFVSIERDITKQKEIDRMKTEILSLVAHQLKTPIGQLRAYLDNMLSGVVGTFSSEQNDYLHSISQVIDRTVRMVTNILNVSRIDRGVVAMEIKPFDLTQATSDLVEGYKGLCERKGISLHFEAEGPLMVIGDQMRMVEVVSNVLDNAVKYTDTGGVRVSMMRQGAMVQLKVADTGPGIDPETQKILFSRAAILSKAPSAKEGNKLGMYIVKTFLSMMQGDILVDSEVGKGSTFTISMPAA